MKTYEEIKEETRKTLEGKDEKYKRRYLKLCKSLRIIISEKFLWSISIITCLIIPSIFHFIGYFKLSLIDLLFFLLLHMLYWIFKGSKDTKKLMDESSPEIEMMIQAVNEIIDESK
jgi:hypothetical protein